MAKYKVGDVIRRKTTERRKTITHVVLKDSLIKAPWIDGQDQYIIFANCYVVLDEENKATYCSFEYFHEKYELVERKKTFELNHSNKYTHTCTRCGAPAYIGLNNVECLSCGRY